VANTPVKQWRAAPTYTTAMMQNGMTNASWYRFQNDLDTGAPPAAEVVLTVGASPFTYQAPRGGFVIVYGGIISAIVFTRNDSYPTGDVKGMFSVSTGDQITVLYSALPYMVFVPT
jgi:hypothetical protein